MNPGAQRVTIHIYSRGEEKDPETGYFSAEKKPLCSPRAERTDASAREVWEAYAAKNRGIVNFSIRPRAGIKKGMWVECEGQWHEIIAIQRLGSAPGKMILKTVLKEAI